MEELYMNIRKLVYERLDTGRDIDDAELYQVIGSVTEVFPASM